MARSLAGDLIQKLYQQGQSTAQIGKALGGYDQAIIGRVGRGERPGANLVAPLKSLLGGAASAKPAKAEHQKRILTDAQSRVTNYSSKKPSAQRLNTLLHQAEKAGATRVGLVADVGKFQGYEQRSAGQHLVRAFRKGNAATPGALRERLRASGQAGDEFLLHEIKLATGAEQVDDLRNVQLNFYYGGA